MYSKEDFLKAALTRIDEFPKIAMLYRAGDPRITQHLGAIAHMLSLKSQEQEVAHLEGFQKVRPATILADAAMRGIIPRAQGVRVKIHIENPSIEAVTLAAHRVVLDSGGYSYKLEAPVTIEAGGVAQAVCIQGHTVQVVHEVAESLPFYAIQIAQSDEGSFLSTIAVSDGDGAYEWRTQYTNTEVGERIFHVEADERQNIYVRLGFENVVGFQPEKGHVITLNIGYAMGDMTPSAGSPFALDYVNSPLEASLKLSMLEVVQRGQNPISMETLRDLARYPSTYTENAVFLGEFDFLVRKKFPNLQFCSVWNEAAEELARGAALRNINGLFVAALSQEGIEPVIESGEDIPAQPQEIDVSLLTQTHLAIRKAILDADDGYRVFFYTPVISTIKMTVNARVASSYHREDVEQQIREQLLNAYGKTSAPARRGYNRPLYQRVYKLLQESVPALSGGDADWTLDIQDPQGSERPELWRFVSQESLTVNVRTVNIVIPSWGG